MMTVPPPLQTTTYRCHITRNDQNGLKPNERDRVHKRRARNWQEARRSFVYSRPTLFTGTATRQEERKPPRRVNCLFRCRKEGISHLVFGSLVRSSFLTPRAIDRDCNLSFYFRISKKTGLNRCGLVHISFLRLRNWLGPVKVQTS